MKKLLTLASLIFCLAADAAVRIEGAFNVNGKELQNTLTLAEDQDSFRFWTSGLAFVGKILEKTDSGIKANVIVGLVEEGTNVRNASQDVRINPIITNSTIAADWGKDALVQVHKNEKTNLSLRLKFSRT